jgi:transposase InsO family protein
LRHSFSRTGRGRQLQVTARKAARDKAETDFAIYYIADLRPADGTRVAHAGCYLAIVLDLFNREVVGWSIKPRMTADIVIDALTMAWIRRLPEPGALHHSDRGSPVREPRFPAQADRIWHALLDESSGKLLGHAPTESFLAA